MRYPKLLLQIKNRPGLFLGNISIFTLKAFLDGYRHGVGENENSHVLDEFQTFIAQKYTGSSAVAWDGLIRLHCSSDRQAFDKFFELMDEFLKKRTAVS